MCFVKLIIEVFIYRINQHFCSKENKLLIKIITMFKIIIKIQSVHLLRRFYKKLLKCSTKKLLCLFCHKNQLNKPRLKQ